jgi:hypothetical protein
MADLKDQARPAVQALMDKDEEQLYQELGLRLRAMQENPALSGSFTPQIDTHLEALGPVEDLKDFGQRFFKRVNKQAYQLICGTEAADSEERENIIDAFGIGREAVAPAIAALLVTHMGMAPAIAAVVTTLILRLVFRNAFESMCEVWGEKFQEE